MKNNKDFKYEYSDVNLFQTKADILTGRYAGIKLEFASSGVMSGLGRPIFNFEYQLYETPDNFEITEKFEDYLKDLLISIIDDRNKDPDMKEKLDNASTLTYAKSAVEYHTAVRKLSFFEAKKLIGIKFQDYAKHVMFGLLKNLSHE
jgi:hypothetical protein